MEMSLKRLIISPCFFFSDNGLRSPEMYLVIGGTIQAGIVGGLVAGFIGSRVAKERYIKKHLAAQFETKFFGLVSMLQQLGVFALLTDLGGVRWRECPIHELQVCHIYM
jgi:hypothetical protein